MEENFNKFTETNLKESIFINSIVGRNFDIGILDKNGKIINSSITFDGNCRNILIKTMHGVEIIIKYLDIIGFFKENEKSLNKIQEENKELHISTKIK